MLWVYLSFSFPLVMDRVLSATSPPPHLIVFSTLPCLLSSSSSLPPLLPSSHLSQHSPPILALASLVSSCTPHVTMPLSSVVCHLPSFLRVLPTVPGSLLLTSLSLKLLCTPVCPRYSCYFSYPVVSHTCSLCCCRSVIAKVSVPYSHADVKSHKCSWPCHSVFLRSARSPSPPQLLSTYSLRPVLSDVA